MEVEAMACLVLIIFQVVFVKYSASIQCCQYKHHDPDRLRLAEALTSFKWCYWCKSEVCHIMGLGRKKNEGGTISSFPQKWNKFLRTGCHVYNDRNLTDIWGNICLCQTNFCSNEFIPETMLKKYGKRIKNVNVEQYSCVEYLHPAIRGADGRSYSNMHNLETDEYGEYEMANGVADGFRHSRNCFLAVLIFTGVGVIGAAFAFIICFQQSGCAASVCER